MLKICAIRSSWKYIPVTHKANLLALTRIKWNESSGFGKNWSQSSLFTEEHTKINKLSERKAIYQSVPMFQLSLTEL